MSAEKPEAGESASTTVKSLLDRADKNRSDLDKQFAETGVRVRGFNDLLAYLDSAAEVSKAEEQLRPLVFS